MLIQMKNHLSLVYDCEISTFSGPGYILNKIPEYFIEKYIADAI